MLVQASLLARNAPYIARTRTLAHRTRLAALMLTFFSAARWHSVDSSAKDSKICWLVQLEPVVRRGGHLLEGVGKMTLSARQGAARAVSERGPLGYSRQGVCRCAVEDMMSVGTEEGERPVGCGEVVRA